MNGNNLKLSDFGTYSTTPTSLNSLTNRNTLYSNKLSSKAKYMEECINNAISDYYKLDKKSTSSEPAESNSRKDNGYDLDKKMKPNQPDDKYAGHLNPTYENETETWVRSSSTMLWTLKLFCKFKSSLFVCFLLFFKV